MISMFVLSKAMAEGIKVFGDNTLVISIGSPGGRRAKLEGEHIYYFDFHDIDRDLYNENNELLWEAMKPEIAESIAMIALANRDKKVWIIHCEAGISRSPGVALGLSEHIGLRPGIEELERQFPCYNRHVRKLVDEELGKQVDELMKKLNKRGNNAS